jgi:hypothetical protein
MLSTRTRFRGPLVAQTSIRRLAQPRAAEATSGQKVPANDVVQRRSLSRVVVPDSACHAGGRGFESRRSRLSKFLQNAIFCCLNRQRSGSRRRAFAARRHVFEWHRQDESPAKRRISRTGVSDRAPACPGKPVIRENVVPDGVVADGHYTAAAAHRTHQARRLPPRTRSNPRPAGSSSLRR